MQYAAPSVGFDYLLESVISMLAFIGLIQLS